MRLSKTNAALFAATVALASMGLAACSSSTPSSSETTASAAPATQAPQTQEPEADESGNTYCEPLAYAYSLKPPAMNPTDDELAVFGEAMGPVADAASADGRDDLAEMFTLVAQVNSDPANTTDAQSAEALNAVLANADEVKAACGIDLLQ